MFRIFFLFFALLFSTANAQQVTVSNPRPADELVDLLFDNSCAAISNISISSVQAAGSFTNNGGAFPLANGVVLRTGEARLTGGGYTGNLSELNSELNTNSDSYLQNLNDAAGNGAQIFETSFLEFDFIPLSSNFSFDFIFASNEYGEWQCTSQDIVAFILTDLATGNSQNLAVTAAGESVSVRNIRDQQFNPTCNSVNADLFDSYEVSNAQSTINMRGYTQVLNASSTLTPGASYNVRIVIGDSNDTNYDSAIFLSGGSFNTSVDLGPDLTLCNGEQARLDTGLDASIYTHLWYFNGNLISGQTGNSLPVNRSGTYSVIVRNNGCEITDEVVVSDLSILPPADLESCANGSQPSIFDLTQNDAAVLGVNPSQFEVLYFASVSDLNANRSIPASEVVTYSSTGNQTIYIRLRNRNTGVVCGIAEDFQLNTLPEIQITQPAPLSFCAVPGNDITIDLTAVNRQILGGQNPALFSITYFESQSDASTASNEVSSPYTIAAGSSGQALWARVAYIDYPDCFKVVNFNIEINDLPLVDQLSDVITCDAYELEPLSNGNYYTGSNGTGIRLNAGDIITEDSDLFIFNGPDANGCRSESSFTITFIAEFELNELDACDEFIIPPTPAGAFYTQPDGPDGAGRRLGTGDRLTSSQTIYFYFNDNGIICRNDAFDIIVHPLPPVDTPANVVACNSYTLPPLANGAYFTEPEGAGTPLSPGDVINTTQSVYIFNDDSQCTNTYEWRIFIVTLFSNQQVCGSYEVPTVEAGEFYTQPLGGGTRIPQGTILTTSQRIYYYVSTTDGLNCTNNSFFDIDVITIPQVDSLPDQLLCEGDSYILPALTNGEYFEQPGRAGRQYNAGDAITTTQTIYINSQVLICQNETEFTVEVRPSLPVDNLTFVFSCEAYSLPELNNGRYFTQTQGQGTELFAGDQITTTQTIFVYNAYPDFPSCYSENRFTINILGVEVPSFDDVAACDSYILPPLSTGNYYTQTGGGGTLLNAGDQITATQELFIYARNGTRFFCEDESSFTVTISETPVLPTQPDIESCGSYMLPDLPQDVYAQAYYLSPNKQNPIDPSDYELLPGSYTIYKYAEALNNATCFAETSFEVTVYPLLDLVIEGGTICRNATTGDVERAVFLDTGLDPAAFLVSWTLNGELVNQGTAFTAEEAGVYTITTQKLTPDTGAACNYNATTVTVSESAIPVIEATVTRPFEDTSGIRIEILEGFGKYEYQLDNQAFQNTPEFINVLPGPHTVTVRGKNGSCGSTTIQVQVIDFPRYFTPNNDGYHDTWNITSLSDYPEAQIFIFDRFGKLIKNISPSGIGWDGTYRGVNMPSDDYWFRVEYTFDDTPLVFKSHFTLKR
ncbi:choice-of-anchor L domain-containing protein [Leeuwenhoekiella sp. LLG6367-2.1]|uniref:T9SS type B sorting domain-containing protein n=1 Tax=Leeuwenhoekiella sp. LLG6367-2.1 TaxID=3160833 RepID=UPI003866360F